LIAVVFAGDLDEIKKKNGLAPKKRAWFRNFRHIPKKVWTDQKKNNG